MRAVTWCHVSISLFDSDSKSELTLRVRTYFSFPYLYAALCFFAGILLTYIFEVCLHALEHWILQRKGSDSTSASLENAEAGRAGDVASEKDSSQSFTGDNTTGKANLENGSTPIATSVADGHVDGEIGHEGHLVAEVYRMNPGDRRALTRMGVFAGIALAFHVRCPVSAFFIFILALEVEFDTNHTLFYSAEFP